MKFRFAWAAIAAIAVLLLAIPGHAAPLTYTGDLSLRTPVWANRDVLVSHPYPTTTSLVRESFTPSLRYIDLAGSLRITRQGSPLALWMNGEHSFSRGYFIHENKMKIGIDWSLGRDGSLPLTLFSYVERRFDGEDLDRVFVGLRCDFKGTIE